MQCRDVRRRHRRDPERRAVRRRATRTTSTDAATTARPCTAATARRTTARYAIRRRRTSAPSATATCCATPMHVSACGDGKLNTHVGETCDQGNTSDNDGCLSSSSTRGDDVQGRAVRRRRDPRRRAGQGQCDGHHQRGESSASRCGYASARRRVTRRGSGQRMPATSRVRARHAATEPIDNGEQCDSTVTRIRRRAIATVRYPRAVTATRTPCSSPMGHTRSSATAASTTPTTPTARTTRRAQPLQHDLPDHRPARADLRRRRHRWRPRDVR